MSHNPQNILKDITRNPLHVSLVVACALLSLAIIIVIVAREANRPVAKKKVHPLDKPPARIVADDYPGEVLPKVPHTSEFPAEIAVLCERSKVRDWGKISEPIKVQIAVYLAADLHPNDSPYAHRMRSMFYYGAIKIVREQQPECDELSLSRVCLANDHHFADYLASEAVAPRK